MLVPPPMIRLPSVTWWRLTRPPIGAVTRVNSTSSAAASTAARTPASDAAVWRTVAARVSASSWEMARDFTRNSARARSFRARSSRASASVTSARVREDGIVGARVDHEEQIAGLDDGAVGEVDRL